MESIKGLLVNNLKQIIDVIDQYLSNNELGEADCIISANPKKIRNKTTEHYFCTFL